MDVMREQYNTWKASRLRILNAKPKLRPPDTKKKTIYLNGAPIDPNAPPPPEIVPEKIKLPEELRQILHNATSRATIVIKRICELRGVTVEELKSFNRRRQILEARAEIACYLRRLGYSMPKIAYAMNRDHTSILHLLRKYGKEITNEQEAEYGFSFSGNGPWGFEERFSDAAMGDESVDGVAPAFQTCELQGEVSMGANSEQGAYGQPTP